MIILNPMNKEDVQQIFVEKLKLAKYQNDKIFGSVDFEHSLVILEEDKERVFKAIYGNGYIKNRGSRKIKEWIYRMLEAEQDIKTGYIKITMHYLLMQIKIGQIKL